MMRWIWKPVLIAFAIVYFLIDLLFLTFVRPLSRWVRRQAILAHIQFWIDRQNRYVALGLFLVPMVALEPIKPLAIWLMFSYNFWLGAMVMAVAEIIKMTLMERLFHMTKNHLMTFGWFVWCLKKWGESTDYIKSLPIYQKMFRVYWKLRWRRKKFCRRLLSQLRNP